MHEPEPAGLRQQSSWTTARRTPVGRCVRGRINTASSGVSSNRDKPIQNAYAESFIGKFRDEGLHENGFGSLGDARRTIEAWRRHYNEHRPHSSLGYLPPSAFATCQRKLKHATLTVDSP